MANRTIFTGFFRLSYPHLSAPFSNNPQQEAKYGITMMYPKSGVLPQHLGGVASDVSPIMQALEEVCMEEWGVPFAQAPKVRSIQFPPQWKDGDQDFEKDATGNMLIGQVKPNSAGMFILSVKNILAPGCVDHTGNNELRPEELYAGCWCRAQLDVSAYVNKQGSSIISIQLMNVQKCYDDENIGGGGVRQQATQAFAGQAVAGSNCQVGVGQA